MRPEQLADVDVYGPLDVGTRPRGGDEADGAQDRGRLAVPTRMGRSTAGPRSNGSAPEAARRRVAHPRAPGRPRDIERELKHADAMLRTAGDATPPDPYRAGLAKLRAEGTRGPPADPRADVTHVGHHHDASGIPEQYATGLAKLRSANR